MPTELQQFQERLEKIESLLYDCCCYDGSEIESPIKDLLEMYKKQLHDNQELRKALSVQEKVYNLYGERR